MLGVKPYLTFNGNCREAFEFYRDALGGEIIFTQTFGESPMPADGFEDLIMHTAINLGDSMIMASDCQPGQPSFVGNNVSLALGVDGPDEAEAMFNRMAVGGKVTMPLQETFWALRFGMLTDKFGINWMFNCDKPQGEDPHTAT